MFAKDFWDYEKSGYVKNKIARGFKISKDYVDTMKIYLRKYILPYFEKKKLQKINPRDVEKWLISLQDKRKLNGDKISLNTINHVLTCFKIMIKEAIRLEYLTRDPTRKIQPFKKNSKEKSILTIEEARQILNENYISEIWDDDLRLYTLNLLAASTGMRMGEIQALQIKCFHENYIEILHAWSRKYGLLETPKHGSIRTVPIPAKTRNFLSKIIEISGPQDPEGFIFPGKEKRPISEWIIIKSFYRALHRIGISEEERKERNVTFHSWRYFYNSLMRGHGIQDSKVQRLTGHKSLSMTEHYTRFNLNDFQDVVSVLEETFEKERRKEWKI